MYDGILEEHVKQKQAALERAFASSVSGDARPGARGRRGAEESEDDDEKILEDAGIPSKEIKNVFTELRKGANHPLMLLHHFKGEGKVEEVVKVLHRSGYFGGQATKEMVSAFCKSIDT